MKIKHKLERVHWWFVVVGVVMVVVVVVSRATWFGVVSSPSSSSSSSSSLGELSSRVSSNWNFSMQTFRSLSWHTGGGEGLCGMVLWYQSLLSSRVSKMSWASGCTRSPHVSHSGWTM
ncbi:hypothetical protein EYF80_019691 [Liparis tanakae]|uniref:Uncharacterized protein n=1 Tax=Liparis tanakae TaxID=230148 RepID=A0A4Z2HXF0_9TELE|nr:hypothetical protein EYF80_019691 [Liparis tanakae]